jgi:hypothetical protein
MARFSAVASIGLFAHLTLVFTSACGTDAVGTDACRKIEQARCRKAASSCPDLGLKGQTGLEECVQYARDRCLHGLAVADPGPPAVDACITAIQQAATCDIVSKPEIAPACAFLQPIPPPPDAGTDDAGEPDAPGSDANADGA